MFIVPNPTTIPLQNPQFLPNPKTTARLPPARRDVDKAISSAFHPCVDSLRKGLVMELAIGLLENHLRDTMKCQQTGRDVLVKSLTHVGVCQRQNCRNL